MSLTPGRGMDFNLHHNVQNEIVLGSLLQTPSHLTNDEYCFFPPENKGDRVWCIISIPSNIYVHCKGTILNSSFYKVNHLLSHEFVHEEIGVGKPQTIFSLDKITEL